VAVLLSLLINKHGQKGDHHLTSADLIQVVLKDGKRKRGKMREKEVAAKSRNIQVTILQWQ